MEVPALSASRDWSDLPLDSVRLIFAELGPVGILMGPGLVCRAWLEVAKEPGLWRSVDMASYKAVEEMDDGALCAMAKEAVDRSKGQLEVFLGMFFVTDEFLKYIGDRSPSLKRLSLTSCHDVSNEGFNELITKSPLLEDLSLELCPRIGGRQVYESAGKSCPQLRRFCLRRESFRWNFKCPRDFREALGIAVMRELRSLRLIGSNISSGQLAAILDGCPHLELLFLRDCSGVVVNGALWAKCARIKTLTLTHIRIRIL